MLPCLAVGSSVVLTALWCILSIPDLLRVFYFFFLVFGLFGFFDSFCCLFVCLLLFLSHIFTIVQTGLKLMTFLPQPPESLDNRHEPPWPGLKHAFSEL